MGREKKISARSVAIAVLNQFDPQRKYASQILADLLVETGQRQRATDLVFGTLRNHRALDMVIAKLADCPTERIPSNLLNVIRVGAYELIYCPQTNEYAIVNEAVENAKAVAGKKQTGFVNAILRQITRGIKNRQANLSQANPQKTLPHTLSTGCEFNSEVLPGPEVSPADYFSIAFSLPEWLVDDWLEKFGDEQTRQICFASNRRPSIYVRVNRLKTTPEELAEKFGQVGIDIEMPDDKSMIKIKSPAAVTELPGFAEGLFIVQDPTAAEVVKQLKPESGWRILDLCAAPGVKATQLAEASGDKATIIATDIDSKRLEKVKENIERLGLKSIKAVSYEKLREVTAQAGGFDCVLLDVPCSNTGVLSKRLEVRYRIKPPAIKKLTKIQYKLLDTAATMLGPEGKICYSTCSIEKRENSLLIEKFLQKNSQFKLESELLTLPSAGRFDHDGGYVAILAKK